MRLIDANAVMRLIPYEEFNARMAITNAPTIEAEPIRHGHWIFIEADYPVKDAFYICSKCAYSVGYDIHNYCPYCGAKMDEEGEEK